MTQITITVPDEHADHVRERLAHEARAWAKLMDRYLPPRRADRHDALVAVWADVERQLGGAAA